MRALVIAAVNLRRTLRDRTNLFFLFVFPMLLILVLGVAFGGASAPRVGVVVGHGPLAQTLLAQLRAADGIEVQTVDGEDALVGAVERGELEAGLVLPPDYDTAVQDSGTVRLRYVVRPGQQGPQIGAVVSAVVGRESGRLRAARFVRDETGSTFDEGARRAATAAGAVPSVAVVVQTAGEDTAGTQPGRFDTGASSELVLFLFITSMTASVALIETRRLGVSRRMLATSTGVGTIVAGEGLGRITLAALQGVVIMVGSTLLFDVHWGDPVAAVALMLAFASVAGGAALLLGAVARSAQQATAVGLLAGLGMAALGGTMMPLEFFSPTMRLAAHATPHAWAVDGFTELVRHGGGLREITGPLAVLAGTAVGLLVLASWRLRRSLVR